MFVLSSSFLRNFRRHGQSPPSREYSRPPGHDTLLGETTHTKWGFSCGVPCFQVPLSTRGQPGMRQGTSLKQPAKGRSPLHRWNPAAEPARSKENRIPHTAFSSPSRPFPRMYSSRSPPYCNVHLSATTEKPVESRRFDLIGERKLAQQMSAVRPFYQRIGKRRALIVRDKKGGTAD